LNVPKHLLPALRRALGQVDVVHFHDVDLLPWMTALALLKPVVYDVHGGGWVYERTAARTYARRRVIVSSVAGDAAVLAAGPPPGTPVVTAGAAELFGAETGFSK
ncbi:MAG: hypothetical protein K2P78_06255, partial [Gemmataceae bacterium]|nr:hypothetical protein [Gemmataceae bacterium]